MVEQKPLTYHESYRKMLEVSALLIRIGIKKGDKVAILGTSMPNWVISYFGIMQIGAIAVPLLPDFMPAEIENILIHSDSKAIFFSDSLKGKISAISKENLPIQIGMEDFFVVGQPEISEAVSTESLEKSEVLEDDLAVIIYTSGTMGKPKGVMLTHKNICFTAQKSGHIQRIIPEDRFLSILPLSHSYENTIGMVLPILSGACVYFLGKTPTPSILLPALESVRPTIMLSVPLIMEKIYRGKILPGIQAKAITRAMYKMPVTRKFVNRKAGKMLMQTFGGEVKFFGIGGAKLDPNVEKFLIEAKFPYAIGYGLTETSPLLAGANPQHTRLQSTGPAMEGVTLTIHNPDAITGEGEIWAKGPNVMKGYYKEPELTKTMFSEDGWFKTGDLGIMDKENFLFIKGRLNNMIIGANGENIYPEEIESVINNFQHVVESLVIQQKGKLVALVHFNEEEIALRYQHLKDEVADYIQYMIDELIEQLQVYVNSRVNKFSRVQVVLAQPDPFKKTATQKIKRFLYT